MGVGERGALLAIRFSKTQTMSVVNVRAETDACYILFARFYLHRSGAPSGRGVVWAVPRG
jgi:hypothetical protein